MRILLTAVAAFVGALVAVFAEAFAFDVLGRDAQGKAIEGTALVVLGVAPFAAIFGAVVAGVITWRKIKAREK